MRRLFGLAVMVGVAALLVGAASAAPPTAGETYSPPVKPGHGVVPTWAAFMAMPWAKSHGGHGGGGGGGVFPPTAGYGQLSFHGGSTMTTNTTYAIYWQPSNWGQQFPSGYSTLVDQYFGDVAHDSGLTSNVYYTETQYSGIQYKSTFAGSYTDTDPLPASGCSDSATSVCVSDAQLQTEISNFVGAHGLPQNSTTEYFVFFAPGVGSCLGGSGCAFTDYCAYHSSAGTLIYANEPYVENVGGCDAGHHPNSLPGDAVLNVVSHEHNESITDEFGNAWYDLFGYEDGDKCAWSWGAPTGSGSSAYNQTINGHHYMLQLEYSNADRGCVMSGL
jgi:hypothetical protein